MALWQIFGTVGGFMFNPTGLLTAKTNELRFTTYAKPFLVMVLISVLQGVGAFYMILYPEPLYYGLGPDTPHANLSIIEQSNPLILGLLVVVLLIINAVYFHFLLGSLNYGVSKLLARKDGKVPPFRAFMSCNGYGLMPLLLTVPLAAFRIYFFGRIAFNNHDFPFFDMTVPNIIYVILLGIIYTWMFVVQAKINRAMFGGLDSRAAVGPIAAALVTCALLVIIAVVLPPILNDIVYSIID